MVFNRDAAEFPDAPQQLPCGRCIGCRLDSARDWSVRCVNEAQMHDENSFITLTYSDDNMPHDWSLDKDHFTEFMKRLRRQVNYHYGKKIRFKMVGEYGENQEGWRKTDLGRPHWHALIFGHDFHEDRSGEAKHGWTESKVLETAWQDKGYVSIGEMNQQRANYCCKYILKKIGGDLADDHYQWVDKTTGEVHHVNPEISTQSNRPGIGATWYEKYKHDLYKGYVTIEGKKFPVPKYYEKRMEADGFNPLQITKLATPDKSREFQGQRLRDKEQHKIYQQNRYQRKN